MDFNKPRVAMWYFIVPQTNYRNDGACLFVNYNLRKLLDGKDALTNQRIMMSDTGNVVHIQPNMPTQLLGKFDFHLLIDHGEDGIQVPLDWEVPHPNAYWIADAHVGYDYRFKRAQQFDHVFLGERAYLEKFAQDGFPRERMHYLPWAAEPACFKPFPIVEKWDWCFIGHLNNPFRIDLVDRFCKEWPLGSKGYFGSRIAQFQGYNVLEDCAKKFCQSRIVLNEAMMEDVNMRVFEALACKRLLLTEEVPPLLEHFKPMVHLDTYRTIDQAVERTTYYLKHEEERNWIAEQGYQEFLSKHTYLHRTKEILKTCIGYETEKEEVLCH